MVALVATNILGSPSHDLLIATGVMHLAEFEATSSENIGQELVYVNQNIEPNDCDEDLTTVISCLWIGNPVTEAYENIDDNHADNLIKCFHIGCKVCHKRTIPL